MSIISLFDRKRGMSPGPDAGSDTALTGLLEGYSIEVMPRTAAKIEDFTAILPAGTRVYIAHLDGTDFDDMLATAKRLASDGFRIMPHFPARLIASRDTLGTWIRRYREEAGVEEALLLAGGVEKPVGTFSDSMQLLETGLFDQHGFTRLHVAGHPEGNPDIDPEGGTTEADRALTWKQSFSERTDAQMAIVTQFAFDADPVISWAERTRKLGVDLPIHVGLAGPAKLQTLIKFAIACGVGPSISVLKKRASDVTKLVKPYEPTEVARRLAAYVEKNPEGPIKGLHLFPLGGIAKSAEWADVHGAESATETRSGGQG